MLGRIKSYVKNGNEIEVKFDEGALYVDLLASGTIRFHELRQRPSVAVDKLPKLNVKAEIIFEKYLTIKTSSLVIEIRNNLAIYVSNVDGTPILTPVKYRGQSKINSELLEKEGHANQGDDSYRFILAYKMNKGQCFYGLGDKTGYLNKRGYKYINWNTDDPRPHEENWQSLYKSIPFFLGKHSDVNFGIFVDNTYSSIFDFGQDDNDSFYFGCHKGEIDFYLFYSKSMKNIISSYTLLTGRTPLPQIWTLGNQQSRWSYASRGEAEEIVDSYLKNDIPLEVIHLDIDYMEHYKIFTVSDEKFPDFKEMVSSFAKKGVKVVTIIDPGIKAEEGYTIYDEGIKEDYFAHDQKGLVYHNEVWPGDSVFPSFTYSKVREWWGKNVLEFVNKYGVAGIWNDMNEPASFKGPLPNDVVFKGDDKDWLHEECHNVYGHLMDEATYVGLSDTRKRPFIITRAAFAGTQKYSTVWTGDNHSIWNHIHLSLVQMMNLSLCGFNFVGADIGGFGFNCSADLLSRWIEAAMFSPLLRNHSALGTRHQEPWTYDKKTLDIYRKYVKLRYQFIPYMYDQFYNHELTGSPVIRPLVFNYENDKKVFNIDDEFMVGGSILSAPVIEKNKDRRVVYLPDNFVDYWTKKRAKKGYSVRIAPLDNLPLFIKEGSIIPTLVDCKNLDNLPKNLVLEVYKGKSKYSHYQDDGTSFGYKAGIYNRYDITNNEDELTIEKSFMGFEKEYETYEIHFSGKIIKGKLDSKVTKIKL